MLPGIGPFAWASSASWSRADVNDDGSIVRAVAGAWAVILPACAHLEVGDAAAAFRLFREAFAPDIHSGPPRAKVTDAVSFLWRWEAAGHPRDADAWRVIYEFANSAFPHAGVAFSDMHIVWIGRGWE